MADDPFGTQRDVGSSVVAELLAAGFGDADEIGRGGFGIVFRCTQTELERTVAVKVLTAELEANRERFLREQRAMGRLTGHPNIVSVLQVGETQGGYPFLVMQYHRRGSLEARIRDVGPLPVEEVLRIGVKMAGALATAHHVGILHRDIKPANILLTDYGEPALSDFGIAHITGGFKTATGTFTGSPAFTAPETLSGDPPSQASDIYGLGATLFAALTGHAAYERRSGEQIVAQFLRIASESAPDLRQSGIPEDVAELVESAMSRDPRHRPSALAFGDAIRHVQSVHGGRVDQMALSAGAGTEGAVRETAPAPAARRQPGNLPLELTSFVGRHAEMAAVRKMLSTSRLVTLTGIGGVGKTRLALRAATEAAGDFPDGVWLVELGELRDGSAVVGLVATALDVRDESARPLRDVLIEFLSGRKLLLVLDNCEQVVDDTAALAEKLLRACPDTRILATSREALGIGGEAVLRLSPLAYPPASSEPTLGGLSGFDAVALFAARATATVPGFALTDDNKSTVARICSRLDGLPLAIELAAARLRALSPEQILDRLADRYALLTRGSRGAPPRQQALSWSVGWSYELCTPAEQQLWCQLSVFAGSFELEAAEYVCGDDPAPGELLDLVSALVDKSILTSVEFGGSVRYRLIDTLREYGRAQIQDSDGYVRLRRRHAQWYRRFLHEAVDAWFGPAQLRWMERVYQEGANLQAAVEFGLTDAPEIALDIAGTVHPFGIARGALTETGRWLDLALAAAPVEPTMLRIRALHGAALIAALQNDLPAANARVTEGRGLVESMDDPEAIAMIGMAEGFAALIGGDFDDAFGRLEHALDAVDDPSLLVTAMIMVGWGHAFQGEIGRALVLHEKALALAQSRGESVYREYAMWSLGIGWWQHGDADRAQELLEDALALTHAIDDARQAGACLEGLGWISADQGDHRRAAVIMAAADVLRRTVGAATVVLPPLLHFHQEYDDLIRERLGAADFDAAVGQGSSMSFDEAVAFATNDATDAATRHVDGVD